MDATTARKYSTRRRSIVGAIADKLNEELNGSAPYRSSVQSVEPRLRFWDEVTDFPSIQVGAGAETREYDGGGFRFRFFGFFGFSSLLFFIAIFVGCTTTFHSKSFWFFTFFP